MKSIIRILRAVVVRRSACSLLHTLAPRPPTSPASGPSPSPPTRAAAPRRITFKQDGEKLTGKYAGQLGNADLTGTVKGNAIHFTFTIDVQGQQAPVTYDGTVEKNTMKGKLDIGGMVNGTFTATKK